MFQPDVKAALTQDLFALVKDAVSIKVDPGIQQSTVGSKHLYRRFASGHDRRQEVDAVFIITKVEVITQRVEAR